MVRGREQACCGQLEEAGEAVCSPISDITQLTLQEGHLQVHTEVFATESDSSKER